ncbi:hypothetical protein BDP27DRAFT_1410904 [Rhodocollybia butyracea]|uniref:Uncharacterized protein n=1 Tax=Rhodocollybia butyracea TaxID=206335 RepID=A0A9P5TV70_9AGAR|nr:hypothetical protein BDP27DRAFT_1410904 [Rhodocollybia butyracea]
MTELASDDDKGNGPKSHSKTDFLPPSFSQSLASVIKSAEEKGLTATAHGTATHPISRPHSLFVDLSFPYWEVSSNSSSHKRCYPAPDNIQHVHMSISAGPITGVVIGSMFVLVICISVFIRVYRRRCERRRQQMEAGRISPLQQDKMPGADANFNPTLDPDPSGITQEKGRRISFIPVPIPNPQALEPEPTPSFENPQPELPPNLASDSHLIPTSTQIQEDSVNQDESDIQVKVVRIEATIDRMAEQIRHLKSQVDITGDGDSDTPPPTYLARVLIITFNLRVFLFIGSELGGEIWQEPVTDVALYHHGKAVVNGKCSPWSILVVHTCRPNLRRAAEQDSTQSAAGEVIVMDLITRISGLAHAYKCPRQQHYGLLRLSRSHLPRLYFHLYLSSPPMPPGIVG